MKAKDCRGSGYLVTTATGRSGRTLHSTKPILGKVVVYLYQPHEGSVAEMLISGKNPEFDCDEYGQVKTLLCKPDTLNTHGMID